MLKDILEAYGDRCLLILDGFDEHVGSQSDDIFQIILNRKYNHCNVLVTSRPHCIATIEEHFQTFNIKGFNRDQAKSFAYKILKDQQTKNAALVETVLDFDPLSPESGKYFYECPLLLSVLCSLVNTKSINLSDEKTHVGEIFSKITLCLYKYFM